MPGLADPWVRRVKRLPEETADIGEGFARERTLAYEVVVKEEHVYKEMTAFLTLSVLPGYLTPYYTYDGSWWDMLCVLRSARVSRSMTDKYTLRIDYKYSTQPGGRLSAGQIDPGLLPRPPKPASGGQGSGVEGSGSVQDLEKLMPVVTIDYETYEEPARKDVDDNRIVMSNGRIPDPLPTKRQAILVVKVKKMLTWFDYALWKQMGFKLNDDTWNGFAPYTVLNYPWTVDARIEVGGRWWYPTNYTLKVHPVDWLYHLQSMDVWQKKLAGTGVEPVPDPITQQPITYPWPLNASGRAIADPATTDVFSEDFQIDGAEDLNKLFISSLFPKSPVP